MMVCGRVKRTKALQKCSAASRGVLALVGEEAAAHVPSSEQVR
jgi:hypothetical protein